MKNNKGFTLIEMLITMTLVIVVILITGKAFEAILKSTGRLVASEESNIEGVVGLEMFRHDLQQSGYGLPNAYLTPPTYNEAMFAPANNCNDAPNGIPRPIASWEYAAATSDTNAEISSSQTGANTASGASFSILADTDYLAVKATTVGRSKAAKKWTYLNYSAVAGSAFSAKPPNKWPNLEDNLKSTDKAIVLKRTFSDAGITNTLIYDNNNTGNPSIYWTGNPTINMSDNFNPGSSDPTYFLYGVDDDDLGMPFNRADFFVARPSNASSIPATCALGTGILYKATVNHADGKLNYMPLLDCVANMQVVFGWDVNGDGLITESSAYSNTVAVSGTATSAVIKDIMLDPAVITSYGTRRSRIRDTLKYIKVYIMSQEGRKDMNYTNTDNVMNNTYSVVVGDGNTSTLLSNSVSNVSITKAYTAAELTTKGWLNYRWKIYRIVVRPKNF